MSEPKGDFQRSRVKEVALLLAHLLGALLGLGADLSAGLGGFLDRMQRSRTAELANRSTKSRSHLVADLVGDLPADGLRVVNLDGVAVGDPPLNVGDGADGPARNVVAVAAGGAHWDRVAVLLGHPVAPGATVLVLLLLLLLLLPPLLLVPEGGGPLASVAAVALSGVRGGALLLVRGVVGLLTHLKRSNVNRLLSSCDPTITACEPQKIGEKRGEQTSRPCPPVQCSTGSLTTCSPHSCSVLHNNISSCFQYFFCCNSVLRVVLIGRAFKLIS